MDDDPWLDDRQQRLWRAWVALSSQLPAALHRQLQADSGLSLQDFEVLVHLTDAADGRVRVSDLARCAGWERSRLSHQLRRMEQRGLVERSECSEDARGTMIALTPRGRAALEKAAPGHVAAVRRHFVDLVEPGEVPVLAAVFRRVRDALGRSDGCG